MRGNTVTVTFSDKRGKTEKTMPLYQWDYGQKLVIENEDFPQSYDVHFTNDRNGQATVVAGDATGAEIPDELLETGLPVYFWIVLHEGESDGETEYAGVIPVIKRAEPQEEDSEP